MAENRGGARKGAGRKAKPLAEKILMGNPGKRALKVIEFKNKELGELPVPPEFLQDLVKTPNDKWPSATDLFTKTVDWLQGAGCISQIPTDHIAEYAVCKSRWMECEAINSKLGLLAKHPVSGLPIPSPYVQLATIYLRQSDVAWTKIYEIVKANCSTGFGGIANAPENDRMWQVLNGNRGRDK